MFGPRPSRGRGARGGRRAAPRGFEDRWLRRGWAPGRGGYDQRRSSARPSLVRRRQRGPTGEARVPGRLIGGPCSSRRERLFGAPAGCRRAAAPFSASAQPASPGAWATEPPRAASSRRAAARRTRLGTGPSAISGEPVRGRAWADALGRGGGGRREPAKALGGGRRRGRPHGGGRRRPGPAPGPAAAPLTARRPTPPGDGQPDPRPVPVPAGGFRPGTGRRCVRRTWRG